MTPVVLFLLFISLSAVPSRAVDDEVLKDVSSDVSRTIERLNSGSKIRLTHGDIVAANNRNADACTRAGCKWPKSGRYVYIPVSISRTYTNEERDLIIRSLVTFHRTTCIRFVWKSWYHRNYIDFFSGSGCFSYLGRQGGRQPISLSQRGCLHLDTVQHEVLHALGFHHEQVRSDRDQFVNILFQNIQSGTESNFRKEETNNLNTPYDFNSVMHYSRFAFTKNGQPTIVAKSDPNLVFGLAPQMSQNDIDRVNRLYECAV